MATPLSKLQLIAILGLSLLACGPFNQLQTFNQEGRVLATGVATIREGDYSVFEAYEKLERLPGYQLKSRMTLRDRDGNSADLVTLSKFDQKGNRYTLIQASNGQQREIYQVDGHRYLYETGDEGWLEVSPDSIPWTEIFAGFYLAQTGQVEGGSLRFLSQLGAVPIETGHEMIQARSTTRYELEYVMGDFVKNFAADPHQGDAALQGVLWIDDETGALLKSEIFFYESAAQHPNQEFELEVSDIGAIEPILAPTPVVTSAGVVSATATAQAWAALQVEMNYQGEALAFELVPIQIRQINAGADFNAQMELTLRRLPPRLLTEVEAEAFLSQLRRQLTLSIPQDNLVLTSTGFQIEGIDTGTQSLDVAYFFDTNLEDFNQVELILASPGNPLFAPVPVKSGK